MRKKIFAISFLAISISASMGVASYAGWEQDSHGWRYQNANGSYAGSGWLTDPDTGLIYYLAPGGYMMSDTMVEGYKLAEDGHRLEKTDEQIAREARQAQKKASKPTPNKAKLAIDAAAAEAKSRDFATSTKRAHYQAEMQIFMDKIFLDMSKELYKDIKEKRAEVVEKAKEAAVAASLASEDGSNTGDITYDFSNMYPTDTYSASDNESVKYSIFRNEDKQDIVAASYSKITKESSPRYVPYSFDLTYNRGIAPSEEDLAVFDEGYQRLLVACMGETQGNVVYDQVLAGGVEDGASGNTDFGNSYVIMNKNGVLTVRITCSEKVIEDDNEAEDNKDNESAEADKSEASASEGEAASTSSVISAGRKGNQQEAQETQEATESQDTQEAQESQEGDENSQSSEQ